MILTNVQDGQIKCHVSIAETLAVAVAGGSVTLVFIPNRNGKLPCYTGPL